MFDTLSIGIPPELVRSQYAHSGMALTFFRTHLSAYQHSVFRLTGYRVAL